MCTLVHAPYRWDSDEDGGDDDDDDSASEDGGHPGASGGTYCFAPGVLAWTVAVDGSIFA